MWLVLRPPVASNSAFAMLSEWSGGGYRAGTWICKVGGACKLHSLLILHGFNQTTVTRQHQPTMMHRRSKMNSFTRYHQIDS